MKLHEFEEIYLLSKPEIYNEIEQILNSVHFQPTDFSQFLKGQKLVPSKKSLLFCCGGDGSLNSVANFLCQNKLLEHFSVGLVPLGTGNDLARKLQLVNRNPSDLIDQIVSGQGNYQDIQLVRANDQIFLNMASCGDIAKITTNTDSEFKNLLGSVAYYLEGIRNFGNVEPFDLLLECDEKNYDFKEVLGFFVANSSYCGGGVMIDHGADPTEKNLRIAVVPNKGMVSLIDAAIKSQVESVVQEYLCEEIERIQTTRVTARFNRAIQINLDGEPIETDEMSFEFTNQTLKVFSPY